MLSFVSFNIGRCLLGKMNGEVFHVFSVLFISLKKHESICSFTVSKKFKHETIWPPEFFQR